MIVIAKLWLGTCSSRYPFIEWECRKRGPVNMKNEIACVILHEEDCGSVDGTLE